MTDPKDILPEDEEQVKQASDGDGEDTGGSNPPPDKPKPDKP